MSRSLKGQFLIAQPSLSDPNFRCTVVLIIEHDENGAFGLVLNRAGSHTVADLWATLAQGVSTCGAATFVGGPVQQSSVFLLHSHADLAGGDVPVLPGVHVGNSIDLLRSLIERYERGELEASFEADPSVGVGVGDTAPCAEGEFHVYYGYAGWGALQLDREIAEGGWLVQPASAEMIFRTPPELLWQEALAREERGYYKFFALMPNDPELN